MKKILFVLLATLLLTSCSQKPVDTPDLPDVDTPIVEIEQDETPQDKPLVFEDFEYKITARDDESLHALSPEDMGKEFLSALALGETDLLYLYMQYYSAEEYGKAKFDFKVAEVTDKIDYAYIDYIGYHASVKVTISESETDVFPDGEYDYTLLVWEDNSTPIDYFGPTERLGDFIGEKVPKNDALYHTYKFIETLLHDFEPDITIEAIKQPYNSFNAIYHTIIHTFTANGKDYVGKATLKEFKDYIQYRFGYTDPLVLQSFAEVLARDSSRAMLEEDGRYSISCSHGYSSLMYDLTSVERDGIQHRLTYTFYADSAHMLPCRIKTFVFEENKDNEIMTLTDIEDVVLNDLQAIRYLV